MFIFENKNLRWLFLYFFLGSIFFVLLPGSSSQKADVFIPVDIGEVPEGLTIIGPKLNGIELRVSGPKKLITALPNLQLRYLLDVSNVHIGANPISIDLSRIQLPKGILPISLHPSFLTVKVENEIKKELPVAISFSGSPVPGFFVANAVAKPSSVILRGPETALDSIEKIFTKPIDLKGLSESFSDVRFPLSGSGGANNQEMCDVILKMPESGCIPIFKFTPTSEKEFAGVLSNNGQYKLAFFSFGLEGIGLKTARIQVIQELLSWMKQGGNIELRLPPGKKYIQVTRDKEVFTVATEKEVYSFNNLFPVAYTFTIEQFGKKPIVFHCDFSTGNRYLANLFFEEGTEHTVSVVPENCSAEVAYLITYYKEDMIATQMVNPQNPINQTLPEGEYLFCLSVKGYNNQFYKLTINESSKDSVEAKMKMRPLTIHTLLLDDTPTGWGLLDRYLRIGEYSSRWMEATKIPFDYWSVEEKGFPAFHDLYPYETIVDIAGRNPYALYTEKRQKIIGDYLSHKGRFMILSNNAHTVLDNSDWLSTYFGISVKNANVREKTIMGIPDTPTDSLYFDIYNALEQDGFYIPYGSFAKTTDTTKPLLQYASGKLCASFYENSTFRSIYVPFGVDNVMNPDARIAILQKGIELLTTGDY